MIYKQLVIIKKCPMFDGALKKALSMIIYVFCLNQMMKNERIRMNRRIWCWMNYPSLPIFSSSHDWYK
jgi:hypothetical protein